MFDTDDDDFSLSPSSKLSSIFSPQALIDESNTSLTYKAPKQPKPNKPEAKNINKPNHNQSSVIFAKVATLWKNNQSMGKYMAAIIGDNGQSDLIVYQEKTNIVIRETLGVTFSVYKLGNFVAFYDKHKQYWSLCFDAADKDSFLMLISENKCVIVEQEVINNNSLEQKSHKQEILSRISKTGQQILPNKLSDSETESSISDPPNKPVPTLRRKRYSTDKSIVPMLPETQNIIYSSHPIQDYSLSSMMLAQNAELKAILAETNLKLSQLGGTSKQSNNEDCEVLLSKIKVQSLKIDNLNKELERCRKAYKELQENSSQHKNGEISRLIGLQAERLKDYDEKTLQIEDLTWDTAKMKQELEEIKIKNINKTEMEELIKESMNEAFKSIMGNFGENATYTVRDIKKVVLDNLKKTTFNLMDSLS